MNSIDICALYRPNRKLFCRISFRFQVREVWNMRGSNTFATDSTSSVLFLSVTLVPAVTRHTARYAAASWSHCGSATRRSPAAMHSLHLTMHLKNRCLSASVAEDCLASGGEAPCCSAAFSPTFSPWNLLFPHNRKHSSPCKSTTCFFQVFACYTNRCFSWTFSLSTYKFRTRLCLGSNLPDKLQQKVSISWTP